MFRLFSALILLGITQLGFAETEGEKYRLNQLYKKILLSI
jgi:hypothetical protein